MDRAVIVHYHEIGLKGRNRSNFENRLKANVQAAIEGLTEEPVARISSRVLVPASDPGLIGELARRAAQVPGVSYVGEAYVVTRALEDIERAVLAAIKEAPAGPFRIEARRSATDFPVPSMEMNVRLGQAVVDATGRAVDLEEPAVTVRVEVVQGGAYVYAVRREGVGGLPVGTSGKVLALLSAGIDSPVAAYRMMKRGAVVVALHFSGAPATSDASVELVHAIGERLEVFGGLGRVYSVAFGALQKEIALSAPPDLRVLLYRRLMFRVAEAVAAEENARALVTGESLGQVASQTLDNIAAVDAAAELPVLRPLIGMDKVEIIREARGIGTYETSILPAPDCCTLFMPRSPETHATVEQVEAAEGDLPVARMVDDAVAALAWRDFECLSYRAPARWPSR